jgi:hypothetical protein
MPPVKRLLQFGRLLSNTLSTQAAFSRLQRLQSVTVYLCPFYVAAPFRHRTGEERTANLARDQNDLAGWVQSRDFWANAVSVEERRLLSPSDEA